MLKSFSVTNFRSFVDRTTVELRPLTLLFGYNNVGKSALLRALPLIGDSLGSSNPRSPVDLRSPACRGGTFQDLVSRLESSPEIRFGLGWGSASCFEAKVRDLPDLRRQIVSAFRASPGDRSCSYRWIPERTSEGRLDNRFELESQAENGLDPSPQRFSFEGLLPVASDRESEVSPLLEQVRAELRDAFADLQWLGSMRATPRRLWPLEGPPDRLQPDGGGFADLLFYDWNDDGPLHEQVIRWFAEDFDQILGLETRSDGFVLTLSPREAPQLRIPLADTGEGVAQVLPVFLALARAEQQSAEGSARILALEQPELHLHPAAEVALGHRLGKVAASDKPPILVVETHSENLMLSVQLQLAKAELDPDQVVAYWVERFEDGRSKIRRIEFDEAGRPEAGWPRGVFSEDIEQARNLVQVHDRRPRPRHARARVR